MAAVLLVFFRGTCERTLAAYLPVVLASGWSGLLLFLTGVALNPMSVTLSILVVAMRPRSACSSAERYRQERIAG